MAGLSMLRVVSNSEIETQERMRTEDELLQQKQQDPVLLGLAAHVVTCWDAAKRARDPITTIMLKALRQRNGEYEADKIAAIRKQGGSDVYMMITEVKCRAAESWLRDILLDSGSPPWDLQPSPIPDINPDDVQEIMEAFAEKVVEIIGQSGMAPDRSAMLEMRELATQEYRMKLLQAAQARVDRMKTRIEDQFAQGGWAEAFNEFVTDLVTFPAAFVKGPVVRRQRRLGWGRGADGKTVVETQEKLAPEYERVSPFNIYPEPGITRINDGYLFEYHQLTRTDLAALIGVPGYDDAAIRAILLEGPASGMLEPTKTEREDQERKFNADSRPTAMYDALEFWGKVSGHMLREWGMEPDEIPDEAQEYDACVWLVNNKVIKAVLNYDPLGEKPYAKTSFIKTPGSFWGRGIPEIIEDLQNVCNAAARSMVNNMAISSGPQVELNVERLPPNEDVTQMFPWKIWQTLNDPLGSSAPAIRFMQPTDNSAALMNVYDRFSRLADDHSGIPSYIYGDTNVQGAGRTASGLSMLMGSAGKGIRQVVMHIDADVTRHIVRRQFIYNMRYDPDESIKGDAEVVPRGAVNLAVKETVNMRRVEFLTATANEFDMDIIGKGGRAAILREVAKGLQMPVDDVVPSRERMTADSRVQSMTQQLPAPQGGSSPPPASQALDPAGNPAGGAQAAVARPQG